MPYEATGRPPGRPRKDAPPVPPKPAAPARQQNLRIPPSVEPKPAGPKPVSVPPENAAGDTRPGPFPICQLKSCWPDGWPEGATGLACKHGIWSRPWVA